MVPFDATNMGPFQKRNSHLICVVNNITQHQKNEFNKSKYFSALENSIDGVAFLSIEGFAPM